MHHVLGALDFANVTAMVVGDVMLDTYCYGDITRISPEAPVPILNVTRTAKMPGGAANVAGNLASLGSRTVIFGVVGDDAPGRELSTLLHEKLGSQCVHLVTDGETLTPSKTRFVGGQQQILRVDREDRNWISRSTEARLIERVKHWLDGNNCNCIILSDYAKGTLTDQIISSIISEARSRQITTIVDPKRKDFSVYSGSTFIKPNLKELAEATGLPCRSEKEIDLAADKMRRSTGASILVTKAERGMNLYGHEMDVCRISSRAVEVSDLSGAGDTSLAVFAILLSLGLGPDRSAHFANIAGGIAVRKRGTAVISKRELMAETTGGELASPSEKVMTSLRASSVCQYWREQGLKIGFTNGCFDILHPGHVSALAEIASRCDRLIVGLNSDKSVRRLKGSSRPIQDELSRAFVLAGLSSTDAIVVFEEDTPQQLIELLKPDVLAKSADYSEATMVGADFVRSYGGDVFIAKHLAGHSTTSILHKTSPQA